MSAMIRELEGPATVVAFHRSEVESLHCIAERLVAGWALASVVRLPSGGYLARFNRPRKSAHMDDPSSGADGHALAPDEGMKIDG
ncbi:MAG TPA: hypothetical protein PJ994_12740 [Tepidiformaceae bacterium]|nr:hypothetical protein [Tepidiformaceae bacterium]HMO96184.1 hypothetical protein [Tepidiformaceae bacterium]